MTSGFDVGDAWCVVAFANPAGAGDIHVTMGAYLEDGTLRGEHRKVEAIWPGSEGDVSVMGVVSPSSVFVFVKLGRGSVKLFPMFPMRAIVRSLLTLWWDIWCGFQFWFVGQL